MFTKYQEGKISGEQILAYIQKRIRETGYDRAQQRKWKAALVEYRNSVSDNRAAAEYAKTGNIGDYIAHWQQRLRGTKQGTPERTQIQQQIRTLQDEAAAKSMQRRAANIQNKIATGNMNTKDLIDFYKGELGSLRPGSPLRLQIQDRLATLKAQWRDEKFTIGTQKIKTQMGLGNLTPQKAAEKIRNLGARMNIDDANPVLWANVMEETRKLGATPDPAKMSNLLLALSTGEMSREEYIDEVYKIADQIQTYDPAAANVIRSGAHADAKQYGQTPLVRPGLEKGEIALGAAQQGMNAYIRRTVQPVYQMDGSRLSAQNCTMAAAAMLGIAMSGKNLTGGELRYLSRDRRGGVTLIQAQYALDRAGVTGTRVQYDNRIEPNQFRHRIKMGAPAVLSGFNGSLPGGSSSKYNASGIIGGHSIFVVKFNPKKGYFVLDPAKKNDKGQWWPAGIIEKFGWGGAPGVNYRYGQALFAPQNTLPTKWNGGQRGKTAGRPSKTERGSGGGGRRVDMAGRISHVYVGDVPPADRNVPESYVGQFAPGPDEPEIIASAGREVQANQATADALDLRLSDAGIGPEIDTREEAIAELDTRTAGLASGQAWLDNFRTEFLEDPGAEVWSVLVGSERRQMTMDDATALEREIITQADGADMLYTWMGATSNASGMRRLKNEVVTVGAGITDTSFAYGLDVITRNAIAEINQDPNADPTATKGLLDDFTDSVTTFLDANKPSDDTAAKTEARDQIAQLTEVGGTEAGAETLAQAQALRSVLDILSDDTLPEGTDAMGAIEVRNAQIVDLLTSAGIELGQSVDGKKVKPTQYAADLMSGHFEPGDNSLGALIGMQTFAANMNFMVDNGAAEWMLVPIPGEDLGHMFVAVPHAFTGGFDVSGERSTQGTGVQPLVDAQGQPAIDPATGMEVVGEATIGADVELDMNYVEQVYGVPLNAEMRNSSLSLPQHVATIDGKTVNMRAVPRQIEYPGNTFLRVKDPDQFEAITGVRPKMDRAGFLYGSAFNDTYDQQGALVDAGVLEPIPYLVDVVTANPSLDENGDLIAGQTFVVDRATKLLHADGLPMNGLIGGPVGAGADVAADFNLDYVPARLDQYNRPEPDSTFRVGTDEAFAGRGVMASYSADVPLEELQDMAESGEFGQPTYLTRDANGDIAHYTPNDALWLDMFTTKAPWTEQVGVDNPYSEGPDVFDPAELFGVDQQQQQQQDLPGGVNLSDFGIQDGQTLVRDMSFNVPETQFLTSGRQPDVQGTMDALRPIKPITDVGDLSAPDQAATFKGSFDPQARIEEARAQRKSSDPTYDVPDPSPTPVTPKTGERKF